MWLRQAEEFRRVFKCRHLERYRAFIRYGACTPLSNSKQGTGVMVSTLSTFGSSDPSSCVLAASVLKVCS
jgi:hypothetical protein